MRRTVVVVPVFRPTFIEDDHLALRFLRQNLPNHERVIIAPCGMILTGVDDFRVTRFPKRFFRSVYGYNRLMLSRRFYRAFREYDFILIYQLDALVFRDELERWSDAGYDYVGAPFFSRVGDERVEALNGGLSLRRVAAFSEVLHRGDWSLLFTAHKGMPFLGRNVALRILRLLLLSIHFSGLANVIPALIWRSKQHEDGFWSKYAKHFLRSFTVAPDDVAAAFAFEAQPSRLYKQLGEQLPFGCHAWRKWEPEFWKAVLATGRPE